MDFTGKLRDVHFLAFQQNSSPEQASRVRCCRLRMAPVRFTQPLRNSPRQIAGRFRSMRSPPQRQVSSGSQGCW